MNYVLQKIVKSLLEKYIINFQHDLILYHGELSLNNVKFKEESINELFL